MATIANHVGEEIIVETIDVQPESVLAVIPTLNEERHIEACIRSLMNGSPELRKVPLIVVDGGSTDATVMVVRHLMQEFENLSIIGNEKKLQAAALNLAANTTALPTSEWLVRCDAHSIYPSNFILDVAQSLQNTGAESVVIPMDAVGTTCFEKANAWIVDTPLGSGGSAHRGGQNSGYVDHGHHAGFKLETFRTLGGYDETFSHNEDAEYDARVAASGGRIFLDADIRIQYIPRGDVNRLSKQYFNYGKGRSRNAAKHGTPLKIRQLLPVLVLLANIAGLAVAPVFWPALLIPAGYFGILALASAHIAIKHKSICGLLAGMALCTMHMSWAMGFIHHRIRHTMKHGFKAGGDKAVSNSGFKKTISNLGRNTKRALAPLNRTVGVSSSLKPANENSVNHNPIMRVTRAPEGSCIYAIGDIHGRFDLLETLIENIENDVAQLTGKPKVTLVFLGDYIDRGLQSRQIIDLFLSDRLANFETVFLMGNHEEALLNFMQDPSFGEQWAMYGGAETLFSYGLQPPPPRASMGQGGAAAHRDAWVTLWNRFRVTLPKEHLNFYQTLQYAHTIGDYVFVHAGLKPGVSIEEQSSQDMMWIRDEFLSDKTRFEKLVVHGHTPSDGVYRDDRRIGLDTGAYMTGVLTAARFIGENIDYVST